MRKPHVQRTLDKLKKRRRKGITFNDFDTGFRLAAYIHVLRDIGYDIATIRVPNANGGMHARYVLLAEPKCGGGHDND